MSIQDQATLREVVSHFSVAGVCISAHAYGNGHINDTFRVITEQEGVETFYVLQSINHYVFKEPFRVMENIVAVLDYLATEHGGSPLRVIPTLEGGSCYKDTSGNYWRMYNLVENSFSPETISSPEEFYECAYAFGKFQRDLADFPADTLHATIADFHNTPKRYETFLASVQADRAGRKAETAEEIAFVRARADFYATLEQAHRDGILPLRVSHNDTKSNNVLLGTDTHKSMCVIDLDTIMPGYSVTDFGDAIRFGANTAAEDEKDLSKVKLDMELFRIYAKGFLDGCGGSLPRGEVMLLPEGALMMTLECGMRFLTDYLDGDVYFKTAYPTHNLDRCRTQFRLAEEMEAHWEEMKATVASLLEG